MGLLLKPQSDPMAVIQTRHTGTWAHCLVLHSIALHRMALHRMALHSIAQHCLEPHDFKTHRDLILKAELTCVKRWLNRPRGPKSMLNKTECADAN